MLTTRIKRTCRVQECRNSSPAFLINVSRGVPCFQGGPTPANFYRGVLAPCRQALLSILLLIDMLDSRAVNYLLTFLLAYLLKFEDTNNVIASLVSVPLIRPRGFSLHPDKPVTSKTADFRWEAIKQDTILLNGVFVGYKVSVRT